MTIAEKLKRKGEAIGIRKGEAIGIRKGEAIGIRKGEAIGIRKGEAIGMQKTLMDIVQNMLSLGKSEAEIMQITGLSEEEIKKIIAKINR